MNVKHKNCEACAGTVGKANVIGNILMIAIKGYMGVVGGSKGLIADAIHSSADLLATIVMIIGLKISDREEDERYPYGYGKAEYIVSVVIYLFLFVIGVYIIYEGIMAIVTGKITIPCLSAVWGAVFSILINELMFRHTVCAGSHNNSPAMVAKAWESRSDVYSSMAVLIGIVGAKFGFHWMDPLAAAIVGVVILKVCIEMLADAVSHLMDKAYDGEELDEVQKGIEGMAGVNGIKNIIAREMGKRLEFEVDLLVPEDITVSTAEKIKIEVQEAVKNLLSRKSTIKVRLFAS